jgi:hypothetical protein
LLFFILLRYEYNTKTETGHKSRQKGKTEKKRKNGNFSKTHGKVKALILVSVSEHELPREVETAQPTTEREMY